MNLKVFIISFLFLYSFLVFLKGIPAVDDIFEENDNCRLRLFSHLGMYDATAKKFQHSLNTANYDIGLFGNSRAVHVSASHLKNNQKRYFNFSIPGTSMRQSVTFLEELAKEEKAPKIALISLDRLEFQSYGYIYFPGVLKRLRQAINDLIWVWREYDKPYKRFVYVVTDHIISEWKHFKGIWNIDLLYSRLVFILPDYFSHVKGFEYSYLNDGSMSEKPLKSGNDQILEISGQFKLMNDYLSRDLERLAKLNGKNLKVIIYESPVNPASEKYLKENPVQYVLETRALFMKKCGELGLLCYPAPILYSEDTFWEDCCHAPAKLLGEYISSVLLENN